MSDPLHIRVQSSSIRPLSATKILLRHLFYFWTTSFSAKPTFSLFLPFFGMKTKSGKFFVHGFVLLGSERIREAPFRNFTKFLTLTPLFTPLFTPLLLHSYSTLTPLFTPLLLHSYSTLHSTLHSEYSSISNSN